MERIIYCGELDRTPDAPDHMGIRQGLDEIGLDYRIVDPILLSPQEVVDQCNSFNSDLVIHGNTDSLSNEIIPFIAGKQVFFMGDYRPSKDAYQPHWDSWVSNSKGLDMILLSNKKQIKMWKEAFGVPVEFWTHGCYVPQKLIYKKEFDYDVVFIGQMNDSPPYNDRYNLIKHIESRLQEKGIKITFINGDGVDGRNKVWRDMPAIYHSSKVVLDISHFWDVEGYASGRYWYSAGLGGCSVTKWFPGCEEHYPKGTKHYFNSVDECVGVIENLLKDKELRESTKVKAYEHNKRFHNYKTRFKQLFSLVKG